jgi:transposase
MTEHTPIPISPISRVEVIATGARRRWTLAEKRRIVAESYSEPVSATARRNGLSASQLFSWRRLEREGRLGPAAEATRFTPAVVADHAPSSSPASLREQVTATEPPTSPMCPGLAPGRIEIVLRCGHRILIDNGIDAALLARILGILGRS